MACKDQRHRTVFAEDDLETIMIYIKHHELIRLHIVTLVRVAVELEVGSSGSVSSLKVILDIAQPGKLDDSDRCSKHINKW